MIWMAYSTTWNRDFGLSYGTSTETPDSAAAANSAS